MWRDWNKRTDRLMVPARDAVLLVLLSKITKKIVQHVSFTSMFCCMVERRIGRRWQRMELRLEPMRIRRFVRRSLQVSEDVISLTGDPVGAAVLKQAMRKGY